jgi:hypothetical protein
MGILPRNGFRCNPPPITFVVGEAGMGSRSTAYVGGNAAIETRQAKNRPGKPGGQKQKAGRFRPAPASGK